MKKFCWLVLMLLLVFELDECYQLLNDDPFRDHETRIKVMAISGGYIQYYYLTAPDYITSDRIKPMSEVFIWIPCPTSK